MGSGAAQELFEHYYDIALQHRGYFRERDALSRWFPGKVKEFPPILCFGFPTDPNDCIPLVTLGTNPSPNEILERHVRFEQDPEIQYQQQSSYFLRGGSGWFDRAERILQALSERLPDERRASYGGSFATGIRNTVHLDLSPVITAPIDRTRTGSGKLVKALGDARDHADDLDDMVQFADFQSDLDLESERLSAVPAELGELLRRGAHEILRPLLSAFVDRHRTRAVIVLGGQSWLKKVGLDSAPEGQGWPKVEWAFLGSGPSAHCPTNILVDRTRRERRARAVLEDALTKDDT